MNLKHKLDAVFDKYHRADLLKTDPILFVHRYQDLWDQEAVALLASVLAYGRVAHIQSSVEKVLGHMSQLSKSPSLFVKSLLGSAAQRDARGEFKNFVHRFTSGDDVLMLLTRLAESWSEHGSLGNHFAQYNEIEASHAGPALDRLILNWKKRSKVRSHYLMTAPSDGSSCKRWVMLLRWMGRRDQIDRGLWMKDSALIRADLKDQALRPDQLLFPLDTHTGRMSLELGLTRRKSLGWKSVLEVTERFKEMDPKDPARYDFALCYLGKANLWELEKPKKSSPSR